MKVKSIRSQLICASISNAHKTTYARTSRHEVQRISDRYETMCPSNDAYDSNRALSRQEAANE